MGSSDCYLFSFFNCAFHYDTDAVNTLTNVADMIETVDAGDGEAIQNLMVNLSEENKDLEIKDNHNKFSEDRSTSQNSSGKGSNS